MSRPPGWDHMSRDQQAAWRRQEEAQAYARMDAEVAEERQSRAEREAREARDIARQEVESYREEARLARDELDEVYEDVTACQEWMKSQAAVLDAAVLQRRDTIPFAVRDVVEDHVRQLRIRSGLESQTPPPHGG